MKKEHFASTLLSFVYETEMGDDRAVVGFVIVDVLYLGQIFHSSWVGIGPK